jgi:hypothetical protein
VLYTASSTEVCRTVSDAQHVQCDRSSASRHRRDESALLQTPYSTNFEQMHFATSNYRNVRLYSMVYAEWSQVTRLMRALVSFMKYLMTE